MLCLCENLIYKNIITIINDNIYELCIINVRTAENKIILTLKLISHFACVCVCKIYDDTNVCNDIGITR